MSEQPLYTRLAANTLGVLMNDVAAAIKLLDSGKSVAAQEKLEAALAEAELQMFGDFTAYKKSKEEQTA